MRESKGVLKTEECFHSNFLLMVCSQGMTLETIVLGMGVGVLSLESVLDGAWPLWSYLWDLNVLNLFVKPLKTKIQ